MAELEYGIVRGRYQAATANVVKAATGTVSFDAVAPDEIVVTGPPARNVTRRRVKATFDGDGHVVQEGSLVNYLTLAVGRWRVNFENADGVTVAPFDFEVTAANTLENPVELPLVAPVPLPPTVKPIVTEQLYLDTVAARDAALAAAALANAPVTVLDLENITGAVALTLAQTRGRFVRARLTGNVVLTVPAGVAGEAFDFTLRTAQDGTGGRTLRLTGVRTPYGLPIVLSAAGNAVDVIRVEWDGTAWSAYLGGAAMAVPTAWA